MNDAGKIKNATLRMKVMGRIDNARWLLGKLNKGSTIIDIGRNRSLLKYAASAYGMEKRLIFMYYHGGQIICRGVRLIYD